MNTATVARLRRDVAMLSARLAPPRRWASAEAMAEAAGVAPDDWQRRALRSTSPRMLMNCARQTGKTTVVAHLAVHAVLAEPGALVLVISPTLRQSGEVFRRCLGVYRALGRPVAPESETALSLGLVNGSRIVSLPGKDASVRVYAAVRLLIVDEASRVPNDLYVGVRPMLATSGGRLVALSTPFGTRGWWYEAWRSDEPWERYEVPAASCPRIPAEFLTEERRALGQFFFEQEYECRFLDALSAAFRREDVDRAFSKEIEQWAL